MKKLALMVALCLSISCWLSSGFLPENDAGESTFRLPRALLVIEDEAFAGTAVRSASLPPSLVSIGERAFADNPELRTVSIPASVRSIGDSAFDGAPCLTIQAEAGSYAERWAKEHGVGFIRPGSARSLMKRLLMEKGSLLLALLCLPPAFPLMPRRQTQRRGKSMRPQERPELYPINYKFP